MKHQDFIRAMHRSPAEAVAAASERAWEDVANARRAYRLSLEIGEDERREAVVELGQLAAQVIKVSMEGYIQLSRAAAASEQRARSLFARYDQDIRSTLRASDDE